jgi:hypothetical protein
LRADQVCEFVLFQCLVLTARVSYTTVGSPAVLSSSVRCLPSRWPRRRCTSTARPTPSCQTVPHWPTASAGALAVPLPRMGRAVAHGGRCSRALYTHPGGHYVPSNAPFTGAVRAFLEPFVVQKRRGDEQAVAGSAAAAADS